MAEHETTETEDSLDELQFLSMQISGPNVFSYLHPDGKYIQLDNTTGKDMDLSNWILQHRPNREHRIEFTFPSHTILTTGKKLTIWANGYRTERGDGDLVMEEYDSWGIVDNVITVLMNNMRQNMAICRCWSGNRTSSGPYEKDDPQLHDPGFVDSVTI